MDLGGVDTSCGEHVASSGMEQWGVVTGGCDFPRGAAGAVRVDRVEWRVGRGVVGPEVEDEASDGRDWAEVGMPGGAVANPLAFDGVLLVSERKHYVGSITDVIQRTRRSILVGPVWS